MDELDEYIADCAGWCGLELTARQRVVLFAAMSYGNMLIEAQENAERGSEEARLLLGYLRRRRERQ